MPLVGREFAKEPAEVLFLRRRVSGNTGKLANLSLGRLPSDSGVQHEGRPQL